MLGRIIAYRQKPMVESADRHFLRPRQLLSADRIDFFDAINLVIYAKLPLLSVLKGRDLIAGYIRRDETSGINSLRSFHGEVELLERYSHHIDRLTFPVGPSVYEPLLDHMSRANEYALPYFFHEHHLMVDRRRRAALFALQYKELQGDVMSGNVSLQKTDAELSSMLIAGSWMTNDTLIEYLRKRGVLPWWENEANLSSHALLERMVLSDSLTGSPASTLGDVVYASQRLPEPFGPRWTGPRNQIQGPANTPEAASQGLTLPASDAAVPSTPSSRGLLQRFLAAVKPTVSSNGADSKGGDEASGQIDPSKVEDARTTAGSDVQQKHLTALGVGGDNQQQGVEKQSQAIPLEVELITPRIPPEHEQYDEQQAPSYLLATKLLRHSRFRRGDQQAPLGIQAPSAPLKASDLPLPPTEMLGSPVATEVPREKGKAPAKEPPVPVTHHQQAATDKEDFSAKNRGSNERTALGNQSQASTDPADEYADETLMTRDDVAEFLNRHVNSVDNYRKQPGFPDAVLIGDSPMWKRGQIRKWRDRKSAK